MFLKIWRFITILLAAFSLGLSLAHLLELPPRMRFDQTLWVRVTVFENVYALFGIIGAFFETGAILAAIVLIFLVRKRGATFYWTIAGTVFLIIAFASWIIFVAPMNAEFAKWLTAPMPPDWTRFRNQWEYAHAANAFIKIFGFAFLIISALVETPENSNQIVEE